MLRAKRPVSLRTYRQSIACWCRWSFLFFLDVAGIDKCHWAIDVNNGLNNAGDISIVPLPSKFAHFISRPQQRNQMSTGRCANSSDTVRIDVKARGVRSQPSNSSFEIVNLRRVLCLVRKPVLDWSRQHNLVVQAPLQTGSPSHDCR